MIFLSISHSSHLRRHQFLQLRTLYDAVSSLKWPRDRGLDHAVERDKLLKPLINLKNLIISEPSKSLPLALITESKGTLGIPFRPIEFLRKYPSIFQEFQPGSLNIQPHIKLTPEVISLSSEEDLLYQSVNYKQDVAGRLLKLLMICRVNKIPIFLLERLKWELGLPLDYDKALIPEFPDYFRVIGGKNLGGNEKELELVCWDDELAVSEIEKKEEKGGNIAFKLLFSKEFEMDKKYKKWLNEWQKLPYISPYTNAMHLGTKTDESDKWVVSILHEVLNLCVGKKAERDNLLSLGEFLGLRAGFKRAFLEHPGIFYVSSKIGTHTVVLKEAYKRGMLIDRHPLMDMRAKYIKLMNVKDEEKPKSGEKKSGIDVEKSEGGELEDVEGEEEDDDEMYDSSDDDESEDYSEDIEVENVTRRSKPQIKNRDFEGRDSRNVGRRITRKGSEENVSSSSIRSSRRTNVRGGDSYTRNDFEGRKNSRSEGSRKNGRDTEGNVSKSSTRSFRIANVRGGDSYTRNDFEGRRNTRSEGSRKNGREIEENVLKSSTRSFRRTNVRGGDSNTPTRFTKN